MKLYVNYEDFKKIAEGLDAQAADKTTIYIKNEETPDFVHLALTQGMMEWHCVVHTGSIDLNEFTSLTKNGIRVKDIQ